MVPLLLLGIGSSHFRVSVWVYSVYSLKLRLGFAPVFLSLGLRSGLTLL